MHGSRFPDPVPQEEAVPKKAGGVPNQWFDTMVDPIHYTVDLRTGFVDMLNLMPTYSRVLLSPKLFVNW
jgi:hypothetical protein